MHSGLTTSHYVNCKACGRVAAFDLRLGKCTVTSCAEYFGRPEEPADPEPMPPRSRALLLAEQAVLLEAAMFIGFPSTANKAALREAVAHWDNLLRAGNRKVLPFPTRQQHT